jgi:N-acetyl sugar amidotransferase
MKIYDETILKNNLEANFGRPYQQCSISVMDTISDPNITFNANGICNYYFEFQAKYNDQVKSGKDAENELSRMLSVIKETGKNRKYDCITGVSGGVDSTYLTLMAKKWGLRPLVVHFDNGWNSEMANQNIQNIIEKLELDLYTLVVDWEEFKHLQLAYLKASVIDIEAITDHAIIGTLYKLAYENNIKYILSGTNIVTEATLPKSWIWNKTDHSNILDIHKKFGEVPLKTYPLYTALKKRKYSVNGTQTLSPLNLIEYNKEQVKAVIKSELNWRDYGGKHYESVWTRFYQGYILPAKFGVDKRKAHLSDLIFSGQISKDLALSELKKPIYDPVLFDQDYKFVLKKFGLTANAFEEIMEKKPRQHNEFAVEKSIWDSYLLLKPIKVIKRAILG